MEPTYRNMATSLAVASPILVLCILLGAAGIFFLLPRASAGYLGAYAPGGEITTGFSDRWNWDASARSSSPARWSCTFRLTETSGAASI